MSKAITILKKLITIDSSTPFKAQQGLKIISKYLSFNKRVPIKQIIRVKGGVVWKITGHNHVSPFILAGHLDTVPPAANWQHNPWRPQINKNYLSGLGAGDMKGTLAVWLTVLLNLKKTPSHDIYLALTTDEETTGLITPQLLKKLHIKSAKIIVGEPTLNNIRIGQKGCLDLEITTQGKAGHASRTSKKINEQNSAIHHMKKILDVLEKYEKNIDQKKQSGLGHASLCLGVINGGSTTNSIADRCSLKISRRSLPQEGSIDKIFNNLKQIIKKTNPKANIKILFKGDAWQTNHNSKTVHNLKIVLKKIGENNSVYTDSPWTEAALYKSFGEVVVWGPGDSDQSHKANEKISLLKLVKAQQALLSLIQ